MLWRTSTARKLFALIMTFAGKASTNERLSSSCSAESLGRWLVTSKPAGWLDPTNPAHLNVLRHALLDFIADFSNWDNSTVPEYLETARALTQAVYEALGGEPGTRPLVAVLPPEMTAEILAASEQMSGVVMGFSQN